MTITLDNMKFYAYHGCFEEEQTIGTRFSVDLTLDYDATKAAATDNVEDAVNYALVYQTVKKEMMIPSRFVFYNFLYVKNKSCIFAAGHFQSLSWAKPSPDNWQFDYVLFFLKEYGCSTIFPCILYLFLIASHFKTKVSPST